MFPHSRFGKEGMNQESSSLAGIGLFRWLRPTSLRMRLMNMLGLFALLAFLLSVVGVVYFVSRIEAVAWRGRQTEAAVAAAQKVSSFLLHAEENLVFLGQLEPAYLAADPKIMQRMMALHDEMQEIVRLDADGVVIASAAQGRPLLANLFTIPLSQWFQRARSGEHYYSGVQLSASDEPYLILAVPTSDGGVVVTRLRMAIIGQVVSEVRFGETGQVYVISQDGWLMAHTDDTLVTNQTSVTEQAMFRSFQQRASQEWSGAYTNFQGESVAGVTVPVGQAGWILIAEISQREAYAASRNALLILGSGILLFTGLVILITHRFLVDSILKPLEKLRAGTERLSKGELDFRVGLQLDNEIGSVAQAFDTMAARLYDSARALDAQAVSLAEEVAERRLTEAALRQNETRYRAIVEDQTELICRFQHDGVLTFVNEAYCQYFDKAHDELVGQTFLPLVPEEDQAFVATQFGSLDQDNPVISYEHRVILGNGDVRWMQWTDRATFSDDGSLVEFQAVGRDVTEQKLAEAEVRRLNTDLERRVELRTEELARAVEELRKEITERQRTEGELLESQKRLQLALGAAQAGAWAWSMHNNQAVWSDENYRVMGLEPGSVEPHYNNWLACVHPADQQRANELVSEAVSNSSNLDIEFRVVWPDGSIHWINDIGQITFDEAGQPEGMYGIQMDITERKQIEAEIRTSLREKEVLLKEIHHRVKNNLQVIASMLNLQSGYLDDAQAQEIFQESQNRVAAMATIHEKLYQSRNMARVDFADYIRDLTTQLLSSYTGSEQDIQLEIVADDIWLGINTAVPCGLILNELVSNALKHAFPFGRQTGQVTVQFQRLPAGRLALSVADNGVGMPAYMDWQQLSSLGLTLVNTLARQIGGRLEVENRQGTLFRVIFPTPLEGTNQ